MNNEDLDHVVTVLAAALEIPIAPEWREGIGTQLAASLAMVRIVGAVELEDALDPAPVYRL